MKVILDHLDIVLCFVIPGSMWEPHMTTAMSVDKEQGKLFVVVSFETAQYSEIYQVSIRNQDFHYSKNISKVNILSMPLILPMITRITV